jgi:hypothetical protein
MPVPGGKSRTFGLADDPATQRCHTSEPAEPTDEACTLRIFDADHRATASTWSSLRQSDQSPVPCRLAPGIAQLGTGQPDTALRCRIEPYWIKAAPAAPLAPTSAAGSALAARLPHAGPCAGLAGSTQLSRHAHRDGAWRGRGARSRRRQIAIVQGLRRRVRAVAT